MVHVYSHTRIPTMRGKPYNTEPKDLPAPKLFLKQWRKYLGVTQTALAADTGVDDSTISSIERGASNPSMETLEALADALGITRGMLLEVDPTSHPPLWHEFFRISREPASVQEQARKNLAAVGEGSSTTKTRSRS